MPYENEHAARLRDPGRYTRFRRDNDRFGEGIHAIWGIRSDGTVELQAIRFDAGRFTAAEARRWLAEHGFDPIEFEEAEGKEADAAMPKEFRLPRYLAAGEVKRLDDADAGTIEGYASVWDVVDLQGDIVVRGAFTKTVRERGDRVPILVRHAAAGGDVPDAIGVTVELREDEHGLFFRGKFLNSERAQEVRRQIAGLLAAGARIGASIGYRVVRDGYDASRKARVLEEVKLEEITITLNPANTSALVTRAKSSTGASADDPARRAAVLDEARRYVTNVVHAKKGEDAMSQTNQEDARQRAIVAARALLDELTTPEADRFAVLGKFVAGKSLTTAETKLVAPRNPLFAGLTDAVAVPINALRGKVVTHDTAPALFATETRPGIFRLPSEWGLWQRVSVIPAVSETVFVPSIYHADINTLAGISVAWTSEGGEKPETEPVFEASTLRCHEVAAYIEIGDLALHRAPSLEAAIAGLLMDAVRVALDTAIVSGDGTTQPLGILNTAGVRIVPRQAAGAVSYQDVVNLKHSVLPEHRGRAVFVLQDAVEEGIEAAIGPTGAALNGRLLGHEYIVNRHAGQLGERGDIVFGNPAAYALAVSTELVVRKSTHFRFRENRTALKVVIVAGGTLVAPHAFAILGGPVES